MPASSFHLHLHILYRGWTDNLLKKLIRLRHIDTHRRYFLTTKKNYQKYGAIMKKQVETMSFHGNRHIAELGAELDKERKTENEKKAVDFLTKRNNLVHDYFSIDQMNYDLVKNLSDFGIDTAPQSFAYIEIE